MKVFWFIPTHGDGRYLGTSDGGRPLDFSYLLEIWRALLSGTGEVNYEGEYLQVRGARNLFQGIQQPYPALYFGGSSEAGVADAAKHIDYYLTWGEPPAQVATKMEVVRNEVARYGRSVR